MVKHPLTAFRERHSPVMPLEKLGELLDVKRETVWRWESWNRFPDRDKWPAITKVTGITADQMAAAERERAEEKARARAA